MKNKLIIAESISDQCQTFKYGFYTEFYRGSRGMAFRPLRKYFLKKGIVQDKKIFKSRIVPIHKSWDVAVALLRPHDMIS